MFVINMKFYQLIKRVDDHTLRFDAKDRSNTILLTDGLITRGNSVFRFCKGKCIQQSPAKRKLSIDDMLSLLNESESLYDSNVSATPDEVST